MPLSDKYNTRAAALYRDKLSTESRGEVWSISTSAAAKYVPKKVITSTASSNAYSNMDSNKLDNDFDNDEWQANSYQSGNGNNYTGFGYSARPQPDSFNNSWSTFSSTFSNLTSNATRIISQAGSAASQKVTEMGSNVNEKIKDGVTMGDIQNQVTGFGSKVADLGKKGWQDFSFFLNKKVSSYNDPNESSAIHSSQSYSNFSNSYQNTDMPRSNTTADLNGRQTNNSTNNSNKDWENW